MTHNLNETLSFKNLNNLNYHLMREIIFLTWC